MVELFLDDPEEQALFFREASKGVIEVSKDPTKLGKTALFNIVKLEKETLSEARIGDETVFGDLSTDPIENIAMMTEMKMKPQQQQNANANRQSVRNDNFSININSRDD